MKNINSNSIVKFVSQKFQNLDQEKQKISLLILSAYFLLLIGGIFLSGEIALNYGIVLLTMHFLYAWRLNKRYRVSIFFSLISAVGLLIFVNWSAWGLAAVFAGMAGVHAFKTDNVK